MPAISLVLGGISILLLAAHRFLFRTGRLPNEPNEIPTWIPFFGHAFTFAKDKRSFYRWVSDKNHEQPFSALIGSRKHYIFHDPADVAAIHKQGKSLHIRGFVRFIYISIWGFTKRDADKMWGYRQEEGLGRVAYQVEGQTRALELSRVEILVSVLYLVITALDSLTRRRQLNRTAAWVSCDLPEPSYTASIFILCHVSFYYILGVEMPHSSRVAGIVSFHSLAQYLIPRSCASSHIEGRLETLVPPKASKTEDSCIGTPS
jgi:hypothetical protein